MEPFYYLHAELDTEFHRGRLRFGPAADGSGRPRPMTGTRLSLFGKDSTGASVVLRIHGYRIHFYVSFADTKLARYCCSWLARQDARDRLAVSIESVFGYKSMLIDKEHQTASTDDYADTSLRNVFRIRVRTKHAVAATIAATYDRVREYFTTAAAHASSDDYAHAVRFYESNLDPIMTATRRLGLEACRWTRVNTALWSETTDGSAGAARSLEFYDTGAVDPTALFDGSTPPTDVAPRVRVMSFDIECLSSREDTMPDANSDPVIQISTVVTDDALGACDGPVGSDSVDVGPLSTVHAFRRRLYTTGTTCDAIPGVAVYAFAREKEMLAAFVDHVCAEDPDIITGYNVCAFDFPYLFRRLETNGVAARFGRQQAPAACKKRGNCDTAREYASFIPKTHDTRVPGRVIFDMYTHVRKEVNLRSYTLNSVSAHFLGGKKKDDIGYKEIPHLYNTDGETRARLGRYCVKDAQLVLEIAFETQTFVHAFERCKVFRTMLQYMIDRGQQVRFYSLLLAWCSPLMILVNDVTSTATETRTVDESLEHVNTTSTTTTTADSSSTVTRLVASERRRRPRGGTSKKRKLSHSDAGVTAAAANHEDSSDHDDDVTDTTVEKNRPTVRPRGGAAKSKRSGYEGATVLDPIAGIYYTPVICLDYASLYPSIMIAHNLCFTTFVRDERRAAAMAESGLAERSPAGHYFLTGGVKKGVLPSILEMLIEKRAAVRRRMQTDVAAGTMEYRTLDGQQAALKIAANSIYGAIGCEKSVLNLVQIPSSVTAYGRRLIALTREHVESAYEGARVVYGDTDSVMVDLVRWDPSKRRVWECATIGLEMAASTTRVISRPPIKLQFETVYRPFLLCTKKRYAAGVYSNLERIAAAAAECERDGRPPPVLPPPVLKYKGLQVVRRDNCTFATRLMRFVLETLMDEQSDPIRRVTDGLRAELTDLFDGRVNMKELVISKEWKRKGANAQPHDRLARRMQERDPNSAPQIGDRVPYVIVTVPRGAKLCDRAEDPLYVMERGLQPDYSYYADSQVAKPIAELLRVVLPNHGTLDDIKDSFWPETAPTRSSDKRRRRRGPAEKVWMKRASENTRRLTDYRFTRRETDVTDPGIACTARELVDVEDALDGLAAKCVSCKNNDLDAVRHCRDRECETLYERFAKLELRRRMLRSCDTPHTAAVSERAYIGVFNQ